LVVISPFRINLQTGQKHRQLIAKTLQEIIPIDEEIATLGAQIRAEKIERVKFNIPDLETEFANEGDLLVIGWGGTYGSLHSAVKQMNELGYKNIGYAHFNYINPMPKNTAAILSKFKKILVCELNSGQFASLLKIKYSNFEFLQFNRIQGLPFANEELIQQFKSLV
jgi:2-oxoglutarate ferredoxin oxidoreductase subunit alpha